MITVTVMNKKIMLLVWMLFLFIPYFVRGEGWFAEDSARFEFKGMSEVKEACIVWQRSWKAVDASRVLLLPKSKELDSVEFVLPYLRVYPDTLTNRISREFVREKIVLITSGRNAYYWYLTSPRGFNRLTIGGIIKDTFRRMLLEVSDKENVHLVYFIEGEYLLLPSLVGNGNLGMILGFSDNGRDSFLDENMQKYVCVEDFICTRYGSMEKYKEFYYQGYIKKEIYVR